MLCQMPAQYTRREEKGDKFSSELWFNATNAPGKSTAKNIAMYSICKPSLRLTIE